MKAAILFLVGFGLLLMIGSNFFGGVFVLLLGLAMIAGGVFFGFLPWVVRGGEGAVPGGGARGARAVAQGYCGESVAAAAGPAAVGSRGIRPSSIANWVS